MTRRARRPADPIAVARDVARAEVARRWPDLANIEPTCSRRVRGQPSPERETAGSAGPAPVAEHDQVEYTFTFAGHTHTPDGYTMPRIARVTVDAERRVVKATTSK